MCIVLLAGYAREHILFEDPIAIVRIADGT